METILGYGLVIIGTIFFGIVFYKNYKNMPKEEKEAFSFEKKQYHNSPVLTLLFPGTFPAPEDNK